MPTKKVKTSSPEAETVKSAVVSEKAKESVKPVEKAEKPAENTTKKAVKTAAKKPAAEKPAVVKTEKAVQAAEEKKTEAVEQKPAAPTAEIEAKPAEKKTAAKPRAASRKKAEKAEEKAITEPAQEAPAKKGILFVASEAFPYAGTGGFESPATAKAGAKNSPADCFLGRGWLGSCLAHHFCPRHSGGFLVFS